MLLIAIDPGVSGGIVAKSEEYGSSPICLRMPAERKEMRELFAGLRELADTGDQGAFAYLEQISTAAFGDKSPADISKLNRHVGHIEMALDVARIEFSEVHPRTWQKSIAPLPKAYAERKRATKAKMIERFPGVKVTLWNADALAIMHWALQQRGERA